MVDRSIQSLFLVDIYLVNANKRNTSTRCEVGQWRRSGIFIANFVHISHLGPVFLLQTLNMLLQAGLLILTLAIRIKCVIFSALIFAVFELNTSLVTQ